MILDFEDSSCPEPAISDVCIVGAGASGIALSLELASMGLSVTLLEGGGLSLESRSQDIYRSEVVGRPHVGIHQGRFRTYGGSTTEWGGQILELDAEDFEARGWVSGSGWPFPKQELSDPYRRAIVVEGLRRVEHEDAKIWRDLDRSMPDVGPEMFAQFSRWCPERNFALLHGSALKGSRLVRVFLHANAVAIQLSPAKTIIDGISIRNYSGRRATARSVAYVLCLGGIESTRLLLQPADRGGALPWQANGVLGRFYQDHISFNGLSVDHHGSVSPHLLHGYVASQGFRYQNKLRLAFAEQQAQRTLNVAGTIGPMVRPSERRGAAYKSLRRLAQGSRELRPSELAVAAAYAPLIAGTRALERLRGEAPAWRRTQLSIHCEQSPFSESTIGLSNQRDAMGLLRARLDWRISKHEIATIRAFAKTAKSVLRRVGLASVDIPPEFVEDDAVVLGMCSDSAHHMGSTRMSRDADQGIVDPSLRLHGIANGYVCSSSVFPSSGFSNPTHTLLALAMRLADRIVAEAKRNRAGSLPPPDAALSRSARPIGPITQVRLADAQRATSQLGFKCSYLLGAGLNAPASLRLLDAAWDAGIRHFDTARLYGQGHTESLMGDFLRKHPDATVATKYGLLPPGFPARTAGALARRLPPLRGLARFAGGKAARFTGTDCKRSLERSLRLLQRDHIDLLLLHEALPENLDHDDLLEALTRSRSEGKIGDFGISGDSSRSPRLCAERRPYCRVLQFDWSIFSPHLAIGDAFRIHYRALASAAQSFAQRFDQQPEMARRWSDAVGMDLGEPRTAAALLLRASLDAWPDSLLLVSARNEEHILRNAAVAANPEWSGPAKTFADLALRDAAAPISAEAPLG